MRIGLAVGPGQVPQIRRHEWFQNSAVGRDLRF
jgi:hypothetical protein